MSDTRNAHQRKLAVMKRCAGIKPDKKHPAHHYDYVSIQNLSNLLRDYCAEEGLDPNAGFDRESGMFVLDLVNADDPSDHIPSYWPVIEGDKGWAFTTKFPLIRTFLVGDGEEADESEMAERSAHTATKAAQRSNGHRAEPTPSPSAPSDEIPAEILDLNERIGERLKFSQAILKAKLARPNGLELTTKELIALAPKQEPIPAVQAALDVPPAGSDA